MPMGWVAAAGAVTGIIGANAAQNAANTQAQAAQQAAAEQQQEFNTINNQQAPYQQAGYTALNQIGSLTPYLTQQFGAQDLTNNLSPNYQFMLNQGTGSNTQNVNANGGGSNVARSNQVFGENYASNAYQNAFNNFNTQRTGIYNTLAGIAGIGQTAQAQTNQAGMNAVGNIGEAQIGVAGASAAGQIGSANAISGGLTNAANGYILSNLLNQKNNTFSNFPSNNDVATPMQAGGGY